MRILEHFTLLPYLPFWIVLTAKNAKRREWEPIFVRVFRIFRGFVLRLCHNGERKGGAFRLISESFPRLALVLRGGGAAELIFSYPERPSLSAHHYGQAAKRRNIS